MSTKNKKKAPVKKVVTKKKEGGAHLYERIADMLKKGVPAKTIVKETGCALGYVYIVKAQKGIKTERPKRVKDEKSKPAKKVAAKKAPAKKAPAKPTEKATKKPVEKATKEIAATSPAIESAKKKAIADLPVEEKKLEEMKARFKDENGGKDFNKFQMIQIATQQKRINVLKNLIGGESEKKKDAPAVEEIDAKAEREEAEAKAEA